ncbi:MAG TPA: hypothetical protein VML75_06320 [Kofleriaceae bacterium]|nr:hypothetical protein [Kofleriaceae bacterium]
MAQHHAELFRTLRPDALSRLIEVRASIDQAFASITPEVIGRQFDMVLDKMQSYLYTEDPESFRSFAGRWMAMRVGSGEAPQNLVHAVVSIGDVVVQVAQARMNRADAGAQLADFARAVGHMTFTGCRMLVEHLADELQRRTDQLRAGSGGPR